MKNKGITLVALVITIIILLILAGITIAQLTGSGLFENARLAEVEYKDAQEKEDDVLSEYESLINSNRAELDANFNDDLKNWISKLEDKNITLEDITNNQLLDRLMNSKNAVDYMLTNQNIMNAVVKSKYAMEVLGKSTYGGYVSILNDKFRTKILSSEYVSYFDAGSAQVPTLSSNSTNLIYSNQTTTSGYEAYRVFDKNDSTHWLNSGNTAEAYVGYNFGKNVIPYKIEIMNSDYKDVYRCKTFYIQASNDNTTYIDVTSLLTPEQNTNKQVFLLEDFRAYQYIRMYIVDNYTTTTSYSKGIRELQIYCREIPSDI